LREAGSWKALQADLGARLPVLMYHHVGQPQPGVPRSLTVSQEQFEGQIRWLARRGYVGICPADWLAWCREGKPLPPRPVLLTFDDGYADLLKHAVPVLKRYGFGAAVFVVSGQIGGTNIWDGAQPVPFGRLLAADEIRELAALGIEIGAHSHSHPDLRALSEEELGEEVAGSARDLGVICNRQILSFAYPYGHHDGRVRDRVRATYDLAYTTEEGMNTLLTDHQGLRRTMVQPSDRLIDFACRVWWGWNPLHWVRQRVSRGPG
jgi:peptidoglycan/xylan/chitin deacetylase (PgdA/CDA1 family)